MALSPVYLWLLFSQGVTDSTCRAWPALRSFWCCVSHSLESSL